ncbi:MAG: hypothetical protein AAF384_19450 [Pseudomonadota bacterium]
MSVEHTNLGALQTRIAEFYETPVPFSVDDYLTTEWCFPTPNVEAELKTNEMLLFRETDEGLDISLFIEAAVIDNLCDTNTDRLLDPGNIDDLLVALEGVSHFQYLVWNACYEKNITLFELELQAEIDKYVSVAMLYAERGGGEIPSDLHERLFEEVRFRPQKSQEVYKRYEDANFYAGKYCRDLKNTFPGHHQERAFISELRRFYRMSRNDKVRHIKSPARRLR